MFAKQSMINRLSNAINRNRSAAKISKVMSSSGDAPEVAIVLSLKLSYTLPILTLMLYPCTHVENDIL